MNISNRTLFIADNLDIMRGIDSECIDLIYLDPPFNTNRNYKAPIGSPAEGAEFNDIWTDEELIKFKKEWHGEIAETHEELYQIIQAVGAFYDKSMSIYLMAMAVPLFEMHRILKPTGSIYLHCDPTASHYLKIVMDSLFGKQNFRNEIVWCYRGGGVPKSDFSRKHDIIFRYSKTKKVVFNVDDIRIPYSQETQERLRYRAKSFRGNKTYDNYDMNEKGKHPEDWWVKQPIMPSSKERTGYPTQKPLALLERIIKASSNEGDIVLDPFCGCATACVAAEKLDRHWIGVDISPSAEDITKLRLQEIVDEGSNLWNPLEDITVSNTPPIRTDASETAVQRRLPSPYEHKHELYGIQEGHCQGCGLHFRLRNLTIDHITAQSKGGTDHIENLQLLCGACNSLKGNRDQDYLYEQLEKQETLLREKIRVVSTPRVA